MEELYLNYLEKKQQYLSLKNQLNQRGGGNDPCVDHYCGICNNTTEYPTAEELNTHIEKYHNKKKDYEKSFVNANKYTLDIEENLKEWGFMFDLETLEKDKEAAESNYDKQLLKISKKNAEYTKLLASSAEDAEKLLEGIRSNPLTKKLKEPKRDLLHLEKYL